MPPSELRIITELLKNLVTQQAINNAKTAKAFEGFRTTLSRYAV
jgi:hypothetical protein